MVVWFFKEMLVVYGLRPGGAAIGIAIAIGQTQYTVILKRPNKLRTFLDPKNILIASWYITTKRKGFIAFRQLCRNVLMKKSA